MKKISFLSFVIICGLAASAHEYFFSAHKYKVDKSDTLEVHLFVADGMNIQLERPMQPAITRKFELITSGGIVDLLKETPEKALPILERKVAFEGLGLIHLERDYSRISLPTAKFLEYLKEDHLENITVRQQDKGKLQRERYSRYIKALVQSGPNNKDTLYKTILGQNFEIVFLNNPYSLKPGSELKVRVFFMGKPMANKVITARNRTGSLAATEQESRTDKDGICMFKLGRKGEWLIHATHMIPCADKADSDWESFWASYSFGLE